MVRSAALYMVIVIALVIGMICSSLIMAAGFYHLQYSKHLRDQQLQQNIESGIHILLHTQSATEPQRLALFGGDNDSVLLSRRPWGIFDIAVARSFIQADTLNRIFTIASGIDSAKWGALYVIDEDRSISVSGKTAIKGNVFIPKAGIRPAYVDNQSYQGVKQIVEGYQYNSQKTLPALNSTRLQQLKSITSDTAGAEKQLPAADSLNYSWLKATHRFDLGKKICQLSNCYLKGNAVILSDTLVTIDSTAHLEQVLVFAKAISVASGFKGKCQLFATDSVSVGARCEFNYPSAVGLIRWNDHYQSSGRIIIGDNCRLTGAIFAYEQHPGQVLPMIDLGKNVLVKGQLYVAGNIGLHPGIQIQGSVFANRFIYTSGYTRYENYLINVQLDAPALSPYYLSSDLFPISSQIQKPLEWLN